jgi:hypothetical protein
MMDSITPVTYYNGIAWHATPPAQWHPDGTAAPPGWQRYPGGPCGDPLPPQATQTAYERDMTSVKVQLTACVSGPAPRPNRADFAKGRGGRPLSGRGR